MFQFLGSKTNFRVLELILYESLETKIVLYKFSDKFMASWFVKEKEEEKTKFLVELEMVLSGFKVNRFNCERNCTWSGFPIDCFCFTL